MSMQGHHEVLDFFRNLNTWLSGYIYWCFRVTTFDYGYNHNLQTEVYVIFFLIVSSPIFIRIIAIGLEAFQIDQPGLKAGCREKGRWILIFCLVTLTKGRYWDILPSSLNRSVWWQNENKWRSQRVPHRGLRFLPPATPVGEASWHFHPEGCISGRELSELAGRRRCCSLIIFWAPWDSLTLPNLLEADIQAAWGNGLFDSQRSPNLSISLNRLSPLEAPSRPPTDATVPSSLLSLTIRMLGEAEENTQLAGSLQDVLRKHFSHFHCSAQCSSLLRPLSPPFLPLPPPLSQKAALDLSG